MKALKRISLVLIAFLALVIISAAERLPDSLRTRPWTTVHSLFCLFLIGSFIYLHWLFLRFALPLGDVSVSTRKDILSSSKLYYSRGRILVWIGYFLLFLYLSAFVMAGIYGEGTPYYTVIPAVIFIVSGIFVRIRSVVIYLAERYINPT